MNILISTLIAIIVLCASCAADTITQKIDKETGMMVNYITSGDSMNTTAYPASHTWSKDSKYIFVESDRSRPDGAKMPVERQLLKIDAKTGEATHLATLGVEDTKSYGAAHLQVSSQYHFDYAPKANVLVYYDMTGHNMYLLDVATGKSNRILHEPEGTIGDPPAITPDGRRVVYYVNFPSIGNRFLGAVTSTIFALDLDPATLTALAEPKVITAFPGRIYQKFKDRLPNGILVNHAQINPIDSNHYCYAHEGGNGGSPGKLLTVRMWENKDGIDKPVHISKSPGEWQTHEVIGPLGKSLYFVDGYAVSAVNFMTQDKQAIYKYNGTDRVGHISVSPDEKWIAGDIWNYDKHHPLADGCIMSGIMLIEAKTGKLKVLCHTPRGEHPRHPHPNFSPDGKKIAFTVANGRVNSYVAYIDISDVIKNWNK